MILTMGGSLTCLRAWGLPGRLVLPLTAHTQFPLYTEPFSNGFWCKTPSWFTTQPEQSTNITLHHSTHTFNLFLWLYRWTAPALSQCLPLHSCRQYPTLSWLTSILNRDSHRYEGSVVQNSFTSLTGSQPPMKTGWWNAALTLRNYSQSNP